MGFATRSKTLEQFPSQLPMLPPLSRSIVFTDGGNTWDKSSYRDAEHLLITADGAGSNGSRKRQWRLELQSLADELGMSISVRHFPFATSKWHKIEHLMYSHLSQNWRGKPQSSHEFIVHLIAASPPRNGLETKSELGKKMYPIGVNALKPGASGSLGQEHFQQVNNR